MSSKWFLHLSAFTIHSALDGRMITWDMEGGAYSSVHARNVRLQRIIVYCQCNYVDLTVWNVRPNSCAASTFQCVIRARNLCNSQHNLCFPHVTYLFACDSILLTQHCQLPTYSAVHLERKREFSSTHLYRMRCICRGAVMHLKPRPQCIQIVGFCNMIISSLVCFIFSTLICTIPRHNHGV